MLFNVIKLWVSKFTCDYNLISKTHKLYIQKVKVTIVVVVVVVVIDITLFKHSQDQRFKMLLLLYMIETVHGDSVLPGDTVTSPIQ